MAPGLDPWLDSTANPACAVIARRIHRDRVLDQNSLCNGGNSFLNMFCAANVYITSVHLSVNNSADVHSFPSRVFTNK